MGQQFDDLAQAMAGAHSRRGVLKMMGVAAVGAVASTVLKPFRSEAAVCPAGAAACGKGCCKSGETCSDPASVCCCPAGTTPCGTACCANGVACANSRQSVCGCPPGRTPCGSGANLTCCGKGKGCGDSSCAPVSSYSSNVAKTCNPCGAGTVLFTDDFKSDIAGDCRTSLVNWTIQSGGNVDVFAAPGASGNAVDLDGSPNNCGGNGVPLVSKTTPITIVAGRTYTACFRIGTNPFTPKGIDVNTVTVNFGPVSNNYTKQPSEIGSFTTESLSFVASSNGTAQLTFQEVGPSDRGGIVLDSVQVTEKP